MAPPGKAELSTVPCAVLTPFERGPLRTLQAPFTWVRGAVYDEAGMLLPASQRIGGYAGDHAVSADPVQIEPPRECKQLDGTWLYGGNWMGQFGHFLTETLSTLWPEPSDEIEGVIFHRFLWGGRQEDWQKQLVRRAGYRSDSRIVGERPMRVERLVLPTRAYVLNAYALSEAVVPWQRIADSVKSPAGHRRVYLSRTKYNLEALAAGGTARSEPERDALLDRVFADSGFEIVYPEQLPILGQVRAVRDAEVIAGATGSSLHLSVFAREGTRIIEVADRRSPVKPLPAQRVLDSICGHVSALIPYSLDATGVERALVSLGL